jgi:hypothetical protein
MKQTSRQTRENSQWIFLYLVEIVTSTVTRVLSTSGPSVDYLSESGRFSIMRPLYLINHYIMSHIRLFLFRKGIIECFSAILVFLKLTQSQYYQCIMHSSKDNFGGLYS